MKIIFTITTAAFLLSTANAFVPHTMYTGRATVGHLSSHQEQYDAEEEAALDAHALAGAGMEAAAMERAVMMTNDMLIKKKVVQNAFDSHLGDIHPASHQELYDAEEEEAYDSHDLADAGTEAAAMERAVMMANDMLKKKKVEAEEKPNTQKADDYHLVDIHPASHQELYDAEEEAAFDAHDLADAGMEAAAMERAVMMAWDMVNKKRTELKQKAEGLQIVEKQYVMMKKAAADLANLFKYYEADPSSFRKEFASQGKDENGFAIEMLEKIIAATAEEMLELEREELFVISSFFDALHQEELAEARMVEAKSQEDAAASRVLLIEDFDGDYEVVERKKDLNIFHVDAENEAFESRIKAMAIRRENEYLLQEFEIKKQMEELQKKEEIFKEDLQKIQAIVRDQLRQEWDNKKEGQKS